jgi:hypothetical protein
MGFAESCHNNDVLVCHVAAIEFPGLSGDIGARPVPGKHVRARERVSATGSFVSSTI